MELKLRNTHEARYFSFRTTLIRGMDPHAEDIFVLVGWTLMRESRTSLLQHRRYEVLEATYEELSATEEELKISRCL
jgi:hypothetical protein